MTASTLKIILVIAVLIGLGFLVERLFLHKTSDEPNNQNQNQEINFAREGNLLKDNPGLKPGTWFLSYEESGKPGQNAELNFTNQISDLQVGQRVRVEGHESNGVVTVVELVIFNARKANLIWVDTPLPGNTVISPVTVHGWATGNWYFEATFPIKVLDDHGKVIGQTQARAQGDWMTSNYVEFLASVNYSKPTTADGTVVLEKDNPSGLPQNADKLEVPIAFGTEGRAIKLYYYNPNKDKDSSGNILCSKQGLVAVNRQIPITNTPIQDTIRLLLQGKLTTEEKSQGITTEYPLTGVTLKGANLVNTTLTLEFADPQNKTGGGSCRVSVLWAQIETTAKQFPGIQVVKFKPEELFQP